MKKLTPFFYTSLFIGFCLIVIGFYFQFNQSSNKVETNLNTQKVIPLKAGQKVLIALSPIRIFLTEQTISSETEKKQPDQKSIPKPSHTLSNEELSLAIQNKMSSFYSCQTQLIRSKKKAKGKILINITISPRGKAEAINITQTNINDPDFLNCLKSVIRTLRYRRFDGPEINFDTPLIFE